MDHGAAAASTTSRRPAFNLGFVFSVSGLLKVAEFIMGLLVWPLLASFNGPEAEDSYWNYAGLKYVMFVSVTAWALTLIHIIIYLCAVDSNVLPGAPWFLIELAHNAFWSLNYLIAAIVEAANANDVGVLKASTTFAFLLTAVYIGHTVYSFMAWRGSRSGRGGPPPTSTGSTLPSK